MSIQTVSQAFTNEGVGGFSFRNKIINGGFDVWQRGTTAGPTAGFVSDRWYFSADTNASWSSSQQSFSLGQTDVLGEPKYFLRITTGASNLAGTLLRTRIEDVRTLAGQTVTLSFWAKVSTGTMTPAYLRLTQNFGTGGSPSSGVIINPSNTITAITTSWQKFTYNYTVESISGKTLGTNNNDYLEFGFRIPDNTNISLDIAQVQLEKGLVATPFENRPYGTELALCQRYYYMHARSVSGEDSPIGFGSYTNSGAGVRTYIPFPVTMRTAPSIVCSSVANVFSIYINNNDTFQTFTLMNSTERAINLYVSSDVSGTAGDAGPISSIEAGALLAFDAEL